MSGDIIAFLRARLHEDEEMATAWKPGPTFIGFETDYMWVFHPERMLREVAAKREMLRGARLANDGWTLRLLAEPYASDPDYSQEWKL